MGENILIIAGSSAKWLGEVPKEVGGYIQAQFLIDVLQTQFLGLELWAKFVSTGTRKECLKRQSVYVFLPHHSICTFSNVAK